MAPARLGFFGRIGMFFVLPWKILFNGTFAQRVKQLGVGDSAEVLQDASRPNATDVDAATTEPQQEAAPTVTQSQDAALQLLRLLQREGRLIDFLHEEIKGFTDAEIGSASRTVHEGCRKVILQYFDFLPVRTEEEDSKLTVEKGFAAQEIRLTGHVSGEAPFQGILAHSGWRVSEVKLPERNSEQDFSIVAPAEVEI
jgi:hypothetical protein